MTRVPPFLYNQLGTIFSNLRQVPARVEFVFLITILVSGTVLWYRATGNYRYPYLWLTYSIGMAKKLF